jgi:hypothetical protein
MRRKRATIGSLMPGPPLFVAQTCVQWLGRAAIRGLSSQTTRALVESGVDLRAVHAVADLQRGIEEARRLL